MAVTHSIPPQAYTRETLVKAIEWLGTQPASVRERANSADLMVSFYIQACRRTSAQMDAPVSQENFKADLKHLAQDLKQFEDPSPPTLAKRTSPYGGRVEPLFEPPAPAPPAPQPIREPVGWQPDGQSLDSARELRARLNLSHEHEALRLLITLGMERARQLFP